MPSVLKTINQDLLKTTVSGEKFQDLFFSNCQDDAIASHIRGVPAA